MSQNPFLKLKRKNWLFENMFYEELGYKTFQITQMLQLQHLLLLTSSLRPYPSMIQGE